MPDPVVLSVFVDQDQLLRKLRVPSHDDMDKVSDTVSKPPIKWFLF